MAQLLMGMPRQPFKQSNSFPATGENDPASQLFDQFCSANTFHGIMDTFQQLCDIIGLHPVDHQIFYKQLKTRLLSWKAQSLWTKLDKRAANLEYKKGTACNKTRAVVIGSGPCGLRVAIEIALLGGKAVIVEKREGFSRNNVLHLWPFLIHDLKALGAKKFFGKFCAGAIDHISIRALQCILLKVALLVGVEVHAGVAFEGFSEPPPDQTKDNIGWRAKVTPADHPVAEFIFDICISADGKRNTMTEFKRKEFRGKLAIAITANFINRNTQAEASVEEISGVAYIFNQKFFKDLNRHAGIDLENIVYYKDETHYFVMTAKKQSLLCKGVLIQDYDDPEILLSKDNVDQHALLEYARQAADMSTQHRLPNLEFAHNHYGQPDVAMFDFTSMFVAEHACRVVERQGYRLLVGLVGDTLLEPFWPTGSGCARGFLGAFDAAWMIRSWASGKMTPLEVIAERESIYQLLSQTTPENLNKNYLQYTIDPNTRYLNLNVQVYKPHQVSSQYDGHDTEYLSDIVRQAVQQSHRYDSMRDSHNMLRWIQRQLDSYQSIVKVVDLSTSWHSGMALCALIHHHRPELLDVYSLDPNQVKANNQLAFDVVEKEFGIAPIMTGQEMAQCDAPDRVTMAAYLARICSLLRKETTSLTKSSEDKGDAASKARLMSLSKIGNRIRQRREEMERHDSSSLKRFQDPVNLYDVPSKRVKDLYDANTVVNTYGRFDNLGMTYEDLSKYSILQKELRSLGPGVRGQNKVSVLAKDLASKLGGESSKPSDEPAEVKSSGKAQPADFCYFCKSRVYTVERYTAEGLLFHRGCFRCDYCSSPLRISYYSFKALGNGEGKFYCVQHHGLQRSAASASVQATSALNKDSSNTKYTMSPPKISSVTESHLRVPGKDPAAVKRTPERVEYVTESEVEESEYEQTKHNLCSVLRPSAFSDSDSSSSEEELHFSDEDASDEQPDLSWAELARMYSEQKRQTRRTRLQHKRTSSASSGSETETVEGASDADYETDSNTDKENIAEESLNGQNGKAFRGERSKGSRDVFSKHLLSLSPKQSIRQETKPSPTSVEIMRNRMAFFSTVSQPVRIDARVFLGLAPPPLEEVMQLAEAQEDLMDAQMQVEAGGEDGSTGKTAGEENSRGKVDNRKEERPSKRHAEKKPVVQKAKKRTKRRKKDEKSRVTADVESTRLSTMHEAVPVVSISGATSSDEQDGRIEEEENKVAAAVETTSISNDNVNVKPDGNSDDENMENDGHGKRPEELNESLEPDVQRKRCSAEEGESSRSKSGGSQASENSQTLQYSDSDELLSPRGDLLSGEAMMDSKTEEGVGDAIDGDMVVEMDDGRSVVAMVNGAPTEAVTCVADAGTAKVYDGKQEDSAMVEKHAEDEFDEVLRIEELERDDGKFVHGDQKMSKVQTLEGKDVHQNVCDGDSGSLQSKLKYDQEMLEETDEMSEEQKLEHEYVVLEEIMGEGEAGRFTPYEELVTDGSDKEYTKIEIGQSSQTEADRVLSQGQERIEDSAGKSEVPVLAVGKENGVLLRQECTGSVNGSPVTGDPFDVSRSSLKSDDLFETGKLCVPRRAPRAESESYSDDDGNAPGRSSYQTNKTEALLLQENQDILQDPSGSRTDESHPVNKIPEKVASADSNLGGSVEHVCQGPQIEEKKQEERAVALEEDVPVWNEVVDNLEDVTKTKVWPVTSSEVLAAETGIRMTGCSTLQSAPVPKHHIKKVPMEEMGPAWIEVAENLEAVDIRETWPVITEEMNDETGVHLSALNTKSMPKGLPLKTQAGSKGDDSPGGLLASQEAPADSKKSLDPLARINLLLESLSVNKDGQSGPASSDDFIRNQTDQEQTLHGSGAVVIDGAKKERPNSLIIAEDDQRSDNTSSADAAARLALQTKLIDSSIRKAEKPSRNDLSSDSSIYNASTTSGSVDFMTTLLQQESAHVPEQLRSPTDDSISDGFQGTSLAIDDGTSSIDQLASGSLSEDVLSQENIAEVNVEGEDLADLEVEVWPRVILENKSIGDQALSKRLELVESSTNKEPALLSNATLCSAETSEPRKNEVQNIRIESAAALPASPVTGQNYSDHSPVSVVSNSSASSVLSPNRIMDAKRRFFRETSQPLRIDPRKVFKDIPSQQQQQTLTKEFSGEESSVMSGEFDSASDRRSGVASVLSSGSEPGVENFPPAEISNEIQGSPLPTEEIDVAVSAVERKRQLPAAPTSQSFQPSLPDNIGGKGAKQTYLQKASSTASDKGRVLISEAEARSKKHIFKERKRPNSAFVVMEESWRSSKSKGSPVGLSRPMSAKPVPPQPSDQMTGSPVLGAEAGHPTRMQASQSDGASTEEASPILVHKDKENRLKSFYHQRTKGKDSVPTVIKEVQDKKDKRKSLLALLIPSRSLEKKEKATKSPVLQSKTRTSGESSSKSSHVPNMAVVREKTKSLPLEKKQTPLPTESKKAGGDKSLLKGKLKSKPGKVSEEPAEPGHSIYKEMAGIMEGIKKVEKRNRDKNSIRNRIEAVAPPPAKAPYTVLLPPKADIEDFETESEFGDDRLSLRSFQSQMHLLSEEEAAKLKKRQQKVARKKQREKELKRLHAAQEVQQQLEEVELRQREIERQGVEIEKALSGEGSEHSRDETNLVQQWFDIVYERNVLMRYESELMVQARELELEDRQSRLEIQLRERIPNAEIQRSESLKEEEQRILEELMEVVEQRDALVALLEEDRIRQQQYSKNLERIMVDRGFQLSSISHIHLPQALASLQEDHR